MMVHLAWHNGAPVAGALTSFAGTLLCTFLVRVILMAAR